MEFENIEQLVKYVTINLKKGESITKLERALGLGKDTLRKKLNRANYKFNKELKAFVLDNNTEVTQDNITHSNTKITLNKKENVLQDNTYKTQKKEKQITLDNTEVTQWFSDEDINILKSIIKNYKGLEVERLELQGKITTRSFRTYETVVDMFVKYCNNNKLIQKDAIAQAMINFMEK